MGVASLRPCLIHNDERQATHFDLTDLRLFLHVQEAGTITGGAAASHMTLASATLAQLAAGANRALLGEEVIQFAAAPPGAGGHHSLPLPLPGRPPLLPLCQGNFFLVSSSYAQVMPEGISCSGETCDSNGQ